MRALLIVVIGLLGSLQPAMAATGPTTAPAGDPGTEKKGISARPGLRIAAGVLWGTDSNGVERVGLNLEVVASGRVIFGADYEGVCLLPEVGYTYERLGTPRPDHHLGSIGFGVGYHHPAVAVGWIPRLVLGGVRDRFVAGFRHGIVVDLLAGLVAVDLSHQLIKINATPPHDFRFNAGIDLLALGHLLERDGDWRHPPFRKPRTP